MKYSLLLVIVLSSCRFYQPYSYSSAGLEVPVRKSSAESVKLFYDEHPEEPYIVGEEIVIQRRGIVQSATLSKELRMEATKQGFDAVINIDKYNGSEELYTFGDLLVDLASDPEEESVGPSTVFYSAMVGTPIKYVSNINYLHEVLDYSETFVSDSSGSRKVLETLYSFNGLSMEHAKIDKTYTKQIDQIIKFDLNRIINQKEGWELSKNGYNRIGSKRRMRFDDWELERVNFLYNSEGKIRRVNVVTPNGAYSIIHGVKLSYNDSLIERATVQLMGEEFMTQDLEHNNKLLSKVTIRFKALPDVLFTRYYHYLDNEDLKDILAEQN